MGRSRIFIDTGNMGLSLPFETILATFRKVELSLNGGCTSQCRHGFSYSLRKTKAHPSSLVALPQSSLRGGNIDQIFEHVTSLTSRDMVIHLTKSNV